LNYKKINWVVTAPVKGQNIFNEIHTIEQINAGQWQKIKDLYFATYPDQKEELTNKFNILENNYKNMTLPKNLILYGPPGTGKTYQAREMAKNLLSGQAKTETKEESIGKIIKELTWLDIIGVIMRIMGDGKYRVPELIKNSIAKTAAELKNRTSKLNPTFWGLMQLHSNEASETVKFSRRSGLNLFDKDEQSRWYLTETGKEYFADDRYNEIIGQLKNIKAGTKDWKEYHDFITFHQSYSYEEFIEGIRPVLDSEDESVRYELKDGVFKRICRKAEQDPANKYLLVIDEINRGNISKIFGELLTLVEEDKRIGEQNQITVTLPYSGQAFSVPANLYILGTMNTADRSIALLDVALRRRFKFQELMPEYKATGLDDLTIGNLNLGRLLNKINSKIEVMVDRDHQIGHSYFMKIGKDDKEALHNAWYGEVVPLLQEYFYNDWAKLAQILGKYNTTSQTGFIEMRDNKYIRDLFIDNAAEDYIDSSVGNVYQYEPEALVKALENLL
jgi:5-methylcytosine-specific restriction protein B